MPFVSAWRSIVSPLAARDRWGFALFAGAIWTTFGIALSNILLAGAWILVLGAGGRGPTSLVALARPRLAPIVLPSIAYLVFLVASIAASLDPRTSLRSASEIFLFGALLLAPILSPGERRVRFVIDGFLWVAGGLAAIGLAQLAFGWGALDHRIRGPFSHYMTFAGTLLLATILLVARWICRAAPERAGERRGLDRPWVAAGLLALLVVALLASLTRNAWVGGVVGFLVVCSLTRRRWLLALAPLGVWFLILAPVPVVARVLSITDLSEESNYDRVCMLEAGLHMIADRPLLGLGPEMVERRYAIYRHPTAPRLRTPHLHQAAVELAAERGLLSLAAWLALVGAAVWKAARGVARRSGSTRDLHVGVLGALAAFAVAGLFENNWGDSEVQRLVLFLLAVPFLCEIDVEAGAADSSSVGSSSMISSSAQLGSAQPGSDDWRSAESGSERSSADEEFG